jgi:hypothetical protein
LFNFPKLKSTIFFAVQNEIPRFLCLRTSKKKPIGLVSLSAEK